MKNETIIAIICTLMFLGLLGLGAQQLIESRINIKEEADNVCISKGFNESTDWRDVGNGLGRNLKIKCDDKHVIGNCKTVTRCKSLDSWGECTNHVTGVECY